MYCISAITAISDDAMNNMKAEVDSDDEFISVSNEEKLKSVGQSNSASNNYDDGNFVKKQSHDVLNAENKNASLTDLGRLIKYTPNKLVLDEDFDYDSSVDGNGLIISKNNYIIDFNGHTINAKSKSENLLTITGNNVTIKNLKYINGAGTSAAFSIIWNGDNGVLDNIDLSFCSNALYWKGFAGSLSNSVFSKVNSARLMEIESNNFQFSYSTVKDITYKGTNIIFNWDTKNVTIHHINFTNIKTKASNLDQIIKVANANMSYCNFINCTHDSILNLGINSRISNSYFENCYALDFRGVLVCFSGDLGTLVENTVFKKCTCTEYESPTNFGKILWFNNPTGSVRNCTFEENTGHCTLSIAGGVASYCVFNNNKNQYGTLRTYRSDASLIEYCNFTGNTARYNGGAIYSSDSYNLVVDHCIFVKNTAAYGGAIYIGKSKSVVSNSTFINNTASSQGKGIYARSGLNIKLNNTGNIWTESYSRDVYAPNVFDDTYDYLYVSVDGTGSGVSRDQPTTFGNALSKIKLYGVIEFLPSDTPYVISQTITSPVTLIGNGVTITNNRMIFSLNVANNININGFKFVNCGSTSVEAPIRFTGYYLNISNCEFVNCKGTVAGVLYAPFANGLVNSAGINFEYCNFTSNSNSNTNGQTSGVLSLASYGVELYKCNFNNNVGKNTGVVRFHGYTALYRNIIDCNFTQNTATNSYGGAVSIHVPHSVISGCTFEENTNTYTYGGAIFINGNDVSISDSKFINNSAKHFGGAIYVYNDLPEMTIDDCEFIGNSASESGGAIYVAIPMNLTILSSSFDKNGGLSGTAIKFGNNILGNLILKDTNFSNHENGTLDLYKFNVVIDGGVFDNNAGGTIIGDSADATLTINGATFSNNNGRSYGSAVDFKGLTIITDSNFINNSAVNSGGALYLIHDGSVIQNSNFANNTAVIGGALYVGGTGFMIKGGNYINNTATSENLGGGAIFVNGTGFTVLNALFQYNNATYYGGALYINDGMFYSVNIVSKLSFNDTNIAYGPEPKVGKYNATFRPADSNKMNKEFNYHDIYERGAFELLSEVHVVRYPDAIPNNNFTGDRQNPVSFYDAFLYVAPGGKIIFINSSETYDEPFTAEILRSGIKFLGNNTTLDGYNFTVTNSANGTEFHNITFTGCQDTVINWNSSNGVVDNCIFIGNGGEYSSFGVALKVYGNNMTIINSKFINNEMSFENAIGGTIYIDAIDIYITNCTFENNAGAVSNLYLTENTESIFITDSNFVNGGKVDIEGSAVYILSTIGNIQIIGCNFTNITASSDGAAIKVMGTPFLLKFINNTFTNNTGKQGGAIAIMNNAQRIIIDNNVFIGNNGTNGGALYIQSGTYTSIKNNMFFANNGTLGGAVFINMPINLMGSIFENNTAVYGGALYLNTTKINLRNINFTSNNATYGSAIFYGKNSEANLYNVVLTENHVWGEDVMGYGDICLDTNSIIGIPNNDLVLNWFTGFPSYQNYIGNLSKFNLNVVYVNMTGTGLGATSNTATTLDKALAILVKTNGTIIFCEDMLLEGNINLSNYTNLLITTLDSYSLKRKPTSSSKYLFTLTNGSSVELDNLTLGLGIEVNSGCRLDLNEIKFSNNDENAGGIIYKGTSTGTISNCEFNGLKNMSDDHIITADGNSNVLISNSKFINNNLSGSAVFYNTNAKGNVSKSIFLNNTASNEVRNIKVSNTNNVNIYENTFDIILTDVGINNKLYGEDIVVSGTLDAGVNFAIQNLTLIVNDTFNTNSTVNVNANGAFSFNLNGSILAAGKYNLTGINNNQLNSYVLNYINNTFNINKAVVSAVSVDVVEVSYGMNNTIIITGKFNQTGTRVKYNGVVNLTITNENVTIINATVDVVDGEFAAVLSDSGILSVGKYDIIVSNNGMSSNENYTVNNQTFKNSLTVTKTKVSANYTTNATVVYGMNDTIIIEGTFNASVGEFAKLYNGNVTITINNGIYSITNGTVVVRDGKFRAVFVDGGKLGVGIYNITVSSNAQSLNDNFTVITNTFVNKVNVTKIVVGANYTANVGVVYGMNGTIVIEGTFNSTSGDNAELYNGIVSLTISNDIYSISNSSVVVRDGKFRAVLIDGGKLGVGIYNITVSSNAQSLNANYTVVDVEFINKVTVFDSVVSANYTPNIIIVYGVNNTIIVEGTFNASTGVYAEQYNGIVTVIISNDFYSITNSSVVVKDGEFKAIFVDQAKLGAGIYNITVNSNSLSVNENYTVIDKTFVNKVNVTKANVNCYVNNITVVYGVNDTITISGSVSNSTYGVKYNGLINITVLNSSLSALDVLVSDGVFSVDLIDRGNLSAGKYDISIKSDYINNNYTFINNTFVNNITVNKVDVTAYGVNNLTVVYGVNNTINITGKVSNSTYGVKYNGLINITIANAKSSIVALNVAVIDGEFTINMVDKGNLTAGTYDITISSNYVNNYTFTSKTFTNNVSVTKYVVSVNIEKVNITFGLNSVNIVGNVSNSTYGLLYDGMISVVVGNHTFNNVEVKNGKFTVIINNLLNYFNASVNDVAVLENDLNDNYILNNVTFSDYFIINIASSSINVSSIDVGYSGVINVPVSSENVTKIVAILYNSDGSVVSGINMTVHGITSIEIEGLSAGKYILNVTGVGDINHMNCTGSANITITPSPSSIVVENITVVYSLNSFNVWYTVVNATVDTFVVYDESGNVVSCNIVKHDFSFEISGLAAGRYTFNVTADGGINHEDSSSLSNITVIPAGSKTVVPVVVITYGEHAILNVTGENITGIDNIVILNSTGGVVGDYNFTDFTVNVWNLNSSSVSYRVNVTAKVDVNHTASYGVGLVFVKKAGSAIIVPDNFNMTYNTFKTINITLVNVTEADIIELYVVSNGEIVDCDLSRDGCNITIGGLDVGDYAVIVVSNGTTNYNASVGAGNFKVIKASSSIKVPELTNMSHIGGVIVINQTVNATGISVNVFDKDGNPIRVTVDGFNIIFDRIAVGNYTMNVTTLVDGNHAPSSAVGKICVMKILAPSSIEILNITNGKFNTSDAIIDFNITNRTVVSIIITNESGSIIYEDNDFKLSRFTIGNLAKGIYNITIINQESDYYLASNASAIFKVVVPSSIIASDIGRGYNSPYDYVAVFTDDMGNPLSNMNITMTVDGKSYNVTTNENGQAYLTQSNLPVGSHEITLYNPSTGESEIRKVDIVARLQENKDIVMDFADGTYYSVRAFGDDAKPIAGVYVTIKVNGVTYDVKTNDEGYALLKIRLNPNVYKISAEWKDYKINKIVVKQTLSAKSKVAKKSKNLKYTATLKWSNGNPIVGKEITFKFKGKIYKAKTNAKGVAKIKIKKSVLKKLKTGKKYKINITYSAVDGGYTSINSIYKKIKIK